MARLINGLFPGELQPSTTVAGCIDVFENAWPNPKETIQLVEEQCGLKDSGLHWTKATTMGHGVNQNIRTNYHLGLTDTALQTNNQIAQNVHNQMYMLLAAASMSYAQKHDIHELYHEEYNMLRYQGGQEYKAHADGTTKDGRCVSAIVYLNSEYEGGEVEFVNFGIKIKPEPGMLLLFPSNYAYRHIAHPVKSGTKYAIVTWMKDRQL
jgi:predicted 2-oxoglutarate/Fe(II)-dependent dioxygenase YbiX